MIVGEQKPVKEIKTYLEPYEKILILGCGTCVKTCFAGGEEEVSELASALRLAFKKQGKKIEIEELTIERQCEDEFIRESAQAAGRNQAILTLGCGAGAQSIARRFSAMPVFPGVNTTFIGTLETQGVFTEECSGCGNCELAYFGGICPITRCSKKLMNGPCGGSSAGKCEVNKDIDCAWHLIIEKLKRLGELENLNRYVPPKDWRTASGSGPRKLIREDQII